MPGIPSSSRRAALTQMPVIPAVADWIAQTPGTISLGQGVARFGPPADALRAIPEFLAGYPHHRYIHDAGLPELRLAFGEKLRRENGIEAGWERRILVTAGANQGFLNAVLAICDPGDEVILPAPYYFNHEMAVTLSGCRPVPVPTDERCLPRPDAIEAAITARTRAVVTVSPNNPTGAVCPKEILAEINRLCARRGIFHVSDEAYEYFLYGGATHFSPGSLGNHDTTISLYSLSKSFGMASWRVGFLVIPERLYDDVMKVQDTVAICGPAVSQFVGLKALPAGRGHAQAHLPSLDRVRREIARRLGEIPELVSVPPADGAFYLFLRVRAEIPALSLAERLVREHRVAAIPGETFGMARGCYLRISYGALSEETAIEGTERLVEGLQAIAGR